MNAIFGARIVLIIRKAQTSESKHIIGTLQCILINVFAVLACSIRDFVVTLYEENLSMSLQGVGWRTHSQSDKDLSVTDTLFVL